MPQNHSCPGAASSTFQSVSPSKILLQFLLVWCLDTLTAYYLGMTFTLDCPTRYGPICMQPTYQFCFPHIYTQLSFSIPTQRSQTDWLQLEADHDT